MKTYITKLSVVTLLLLVFSSCELERLESAQEVADGGGTLTNFKAYTLDATDPATNNVFGRIVFWETTLNQTLVQISLQSPEFADLYDITTPSDVVYPSAIMADAVGVETTTSMSLYDVEFYASAYTTTDAEGEETTAFNYYGEFGESKFFIIDDADFYGSIEDLDSHVNIYDADGTTILASGNIGVNADPVDSN